MGYIIDEYNGYIGSGYLQNVSILNILEKGYNKIILNYNNPYFCSNAIICLKHKGNEF